MNISKISCFIDSHPSKQGKRYFGLPIFSPDVIEKEKFDVIVVSSYAYQDEIAEIIKTRDSKVNIIKLYDEISAYYTLKEKVS